MDIAKSFTYVFDDEQWLTKVLLGAVFTLLGFFLVGIPFVFGYWLDTLRNVADGAARPLPDWSNLGDKFGRGLQGIVIMLVYYIPVIILACLVFAVSIPASSGGQRSDGNVALSALAACLNCLQLIVSLVIGFITPAALIRFAETNSIAAAFQFGKVINLITSNLGNYVIATVLYWVASIIAAFGLILCGVGILFTSFWAILVMAHLYGQVWRIARGAGTGPMPFTPVPPPPTM